MTKKMLLVFLCLSLFLSIPGCKKKLPTQPDIPTKILPTINYFLVLQSSIKLGDSTTLSWDTYGATTININPGIGNVSAKGDMQISPEATTTYTLTATNSDGSTTRSCTVGILQWAELNVNLSPENPIFLWDPIYGICISEFNIVINETAGVGGQISSVLVTAWQYDIMFYSQNFGGGIFNPFSSFSCFVSLIMNGQPNLILFGIDGVDNNGYAIELVYWFDVIWTQSAGTMRFLKIVEGASHHKLIK